LDQICKDWARARRCTRQAGANCELVDLDSTYEVERNAGAPGVLLCPDSDPCMSETCQIDASYIEKINDWRVANPQAFSPVANPVCPPHTGNQSNSCEAFPTTVRPPIANELVGVSSCTTGQECIEISLYWKDQSDVAYSEIDMWVTEPSGEPVGWSNKNSQTGGTFKWINWPGSYSSYESVNPPVGTFQIQVHNYHSEQVAAGKGCSSTHQCPAGSVFVRVVVNGVHNLINFDMDLNMENSRDANGDYILIDVDTFEFTSSTRRRAAIGTYTGPAIDYKITKRD
jgi:hypothetical protein